MNVNPAADRVGKKAIFRAGKLDFESSYFFVNIFNGWRDF